MMLNLLLVEDEPGIREGLASFLQLKGYRVATADSCAEGLCRVAEEEFDLIVTDWNLGDGLGREIIMTCGCPALVISGVAETVQVPGSRVEVIRKPVLPADLVTKIEEMLQDSHPISPRDPVAQEDTLPSDARDRVRLIKAMVIDEQAVHSDSFSVVDDGTFVTVSVILAHDDDVLQVKLMRVAGDVRCLNRDGRPLMEVRFFRDGRRDATDIVVGPDDSWPAGTSTIAVDFDGTDACCPDRLVRLLQMVTAAADTGRTAYFLNLPSWLRLHLEIFGKAHAMPNRELAGPRLPEVLSELWR